MFEEEEVDDQLLWNLQILSEVKLLFCFVTLPPHPVSVFVIISLNLLLIIEVQLDNKSLINNYYMFWHVVSMCILILCLYFDAPCGLVKIQHNL